MVQLHQWLHSTFKELSNDTSHDQIQVKTKKLWPRQVGEENKLLSRKFVTRKKAEAEPHVRLSEELQA